MRLATRTGLAAFAAAVLSVLLIVALFQAIATRVLFDRVDAQLRDRAETAPILAAVGERLSQSELSGTVEGARVAADGRVVSIGLLPAGALPDGIEPGWSTFSADGERWRSLTIEVFDVPEAGDEALVELVAPLGNVESETQMLRRRAWLLGLLAAVGAGLAGYVFGAYASRPITALRRDTERLDDATPEHWRVGEAYGTPEVDDVAATLNRSLGRLAEETERRGAALESARSFASAATHELRVPLQGALTNLNLAGDERLAGGERREVLGLATDQVKRMATALTAVRALAEAEFADPSWFSPVDLVEVVDAVVADETRAGPAAIELVAQGQQGTQVVWPDGVRLAVGNVVRNAVVHGRPPGGDPARIVVTVDGPQVSVDDNGPGIPAEDRARVLDRFERGPAGEGSGLGLAIARQVAAAHQGGIELTASPLGGTRAVLRFGPS